MIELAFRILQTSPKMTFRREVGVDRAEYQERIGQFCDRFHSRCPDLVLKSRLDYDRNTIFKETAHDLEEEICDSEIGVFRQLIVLHAESIDITFLYLVAA